MTSDGPTKAGDRLALESAALKREGRTMGQVHVAQREALEAAAPAGLESLEAGWSFAYPDAVPHDAGVVPTTFWAKGKPITVLLHFTAVCGSHYPGFGRFGVDGIGSPFGVDRAGVVYQYVDLDAAVWHAFGMSHYAVGIEVDASPITGCPVLGPQLEATARLVAWLCKTFAIPPTRAPGSAYTAGLKGHTDGLENPTAWDPNGHYDEPVDAAGDATDHWISAAERAALNTAPMGWGAFVTRVAELLAPPPPPPPGGDMTDEQVVALVCKTLGVGTAHDAQLLAWIVKGVFDGRRGSTRPVPPAFATYYEMGRDTAQLVPVGG